MGYTFYSRLFVMRSQCNTYLLDINFYFYCFAKKSCYIALDLIIQDIQNHWMFPFQQKYFDQFKNRSFPNEKIITIFKFSINILYMFLHLNLILKFY